MRAARHSLIPTLALALVILVPPAPAAAEADPVESTDVVINNGAVATNSLSVAVTTPFAGAVTMRLSNDGIIWKSMPYATSTSWALDDPDAGGTSATGRKAVFVEWYDGLGGLVATGYDSIMYDIVPPVESQLGVRIENGKTVSTGGSVPFVVTWLNSDNVGTQSYEAEWSIDGGAWGHIASPQLLPGFRYLFAAGHSYRVQVRGIDYAGNAGGWLIGPSFRVNAYQESSASVKWSGTWSKLTSPSYWGGASKTSTSAGSSAKFTFTGRFAALVTRVGPDRGAVSIFVNGAMVAIVDLGAGTTGQRRVVWEKSWATSAQRTILVKVYPVPGRTRADVDAFVTGN